MPKREPQPGVIELHKKFEREDAVVLVMNDLDALKVMEAWIIKHPPLTDRPLKKNEDPQDALAALWEQVIPDFIEISRIAKLPMNTAVEIFARLRVSRLIYPDGTAHKNAFDALKGELGVYISSLIRK